MSPLYIIIQLQRTSQQTNKSLLQGESMSYNKSKSTKRFSFDISRNPTAKKAGSNVVTISTLPVAESQYSIGQTSLTMTVKEATVLQGFLNSELGLSTDNV
jgi:hypothetical protein